jgi:A/G-specific adenine glycosylase
VITLWQGLGYNRRAVNLHRAAKMVVDDFGGNIPQDEDQLLALPGVGEYTARALLVFAFGKHVSVVDVNVIRVLSRLTRPMPSTTQTLPVSDIHRINSTILPQQIEKWHEALMDLGATICRSRPNCTHCPVKAGCASYKILTKATHVPLGKHKNETLYFGKPKRIWRGKVLKSITRRGNVTSHQLSTELSTHTTTDSEPFRQFIRKVADELVVDSLCRKRGAHYTLGEQ